jgi:peptide-methionine (S)-S-oxide reductase
VFNFILNFYKKLKFVFSITPTINSSYNYQLIQKSAIFAGGCFWCTRAIFFRTWWRFKVTSGFTGGRTSDPTYNEVCLGNTSHAEVIKITFDSQIISFGELLKIFFATHDQTTLNSQGNDIGTQYRSEVFYYSENQQIIAQNYIELLNNESVFDMPVVTKINLTSTFFEAEEFLQNYYNQNKSQGYCTYIITPKVKKLRNNFQSKLKK